MQLQSASHFTIMNRPIFYITESYPLRPYSNRINNFKIALDDTDKSQFLKAISVIEKLSPINFSDKCCDKFSMCWTKFCFVNYCKHVFLDFSRKEKFTDSAVALNKTRTKRSEIFLNCNKTPCVFSIAPTH